MGTADQHLDHDLDDVDRRLLHRLAEEVVPDLSQVAVEIGTTVADAGARYRRLRDAGGIREVVARLDPAAALDQLVLIFCEFWGKDEAVARMHDIAASDVELMQALSERTERRRLLFASLLQRGAGSADRRRRADAADLLFALTSLAMYRSLQEGRSPRAVHALLAPLCLAVLSARTR